MEEAYRKLELDDSMPAHRPLAQLFPHERLGH
jgi:hypothetical protein